MTVDIDFDPRTLDVSSGRDILPNARYVRDAAAGAAREFQRALPELMTNGDAAIQKKREFGHVWIFIHTTEPQTVQLVDDGIGMDATTMERRLFQLGVLPESAKERSLFGRGLRDVLMSAQAGEVASVAADGVLYHAYFRMPSDSFLKAVWAPDHAVAADPIIRQRYSLPGQGTGTSVRIWLDPRYSRLPKADRLMHVVRNLVQCRPIYEDPTRQVQLSIDGGPLQTVSYEAPVATATLLDENIEIEGFEDVRARVVVYRCGEEFPLTRSERHIRRGGLVVRSGRAAHESTFFEFEHWEGTRHLFGFVTCDDIDRIQREALDRGESEAIVFSDRSGLNPDHPFTRALARGVSSKLQPIVAAEEGGKAPTRAMAESVRSRRERGLRELNRMAAQLLKSIGNKGPGSSRGGVRSSPPPTSTSSGSVSRVSVPQPLLPAPVYFPQPVYFIKAEQKRTITALIDMTRVAVGAEIEVILEDDSAGRVVHDATLSASKGSIQRLKIGLRAGKSPTRTVLLLRVGTSTAETELVIQSHKQRGIFSDIRPVEQDNPYMQARFNAVSGEVDVFIGRPEFASLVRAGERAMGPSRALDYPPYEVKEIDAALTVVYQFLAQKHQERLQENQGVPQQVLQARVLAQVEDLRYEWEAKLMKAFLSDATYEGRVIVSSSGEKVARTRARRRGARVSSGAVSPQSRDQTSGA
jgi:hypothetical protein